LGTLQASAGRLAEGGVADVCVVRSDAWWTPTAQNLRSQSHHSPFMGRELPGQVVATLVAGQVAYLRGAP
jgi:dihydroorotase